MKSRPPTRLAVPYRWTKLRRPKGLKRREVERHAKACYLSVVAWLNLYEDGLWNNAERVPQLNPKVGLEILRGFLTMYAQSNDDVYEFIGYNAICMMPRGWVSDHIEAASEPLLKKDDVEVWKRILKVFRGEPKWKLAVRAMFHSNPAIQQIGHKVLAEKSLDREYTFDEWQALPLEAQWYVQCQWSPYFPEKGQQTREAIVHAFKEAYPELAKDAIRIWSDFGDKDVAYLFVVVKDASIRLPKRFEGVRIAKGIARNKRVKVKWVRM